ncbi:MAG: PaaI family thioesterase [Acidobacteria bacterium]|nr:PaaI family thioesterase [Acidobacteriota bacterium]
MDESKERIHEHLKAHSSRIAFLKHMGIEVLDVRAGWVRMRMNYQPELMQPHAMHGGAIYSLADSAAAHALMSLTLPDHFVTTVEQRINFFKAVQEQNVYAEAHVVHAGKTLAYSEVAITMEDGTLVAKSTATLMKLDAARVKK